MDRARWGAAGASWCCQQWVLPDVYNNYVTEESRICLSEGESQPVLMVRLTICFGAVQIIIF